MSTKIEWTNETWNPVRGCSIVSKGCKNCYAMRQAHRFSGPGRPYEGLTMLTNGGPVWTGAVRTVEDLLDMPLRWNRPRRVFVNSMSDLFHEDVPESFIDQVFAVMTMASHHTFQILTKRPRRMRGYLNAGGRAAEVFDIARNHELGYWYHQGKMPAKSWPLPNVWLGVSVEDQAAADERIPLLLEASAAVRWISAEPLLGLVDLISKDEQGSALHAFQDRPRLDWVVAGGESGPGARPMHPYWAESLRDQCGLAGVPFFFKQWGDWKPVGPIYCDEDTQEHLDALEIDDDTLNECHLTVRGGRWEAERDGQPPPYTWAMQRIGKRVAGRLLDGNIHDEYPSTESAHGT